MSSRDMFGDLRREAESIVGKPRDDISGTLNNPGDAPARQLYGRCGSRPAFQRGRAASTLCGAVRPVLHWPHVRIAIAVVMLGLVAVGFMPN